MNNPHTPTPMHIGFLGLGRMGRELVNHLLTRENTELIVWNRTASAADYLRDQAVTVATTPAEAWTGADMVVTCLFGPDSVDQVVLSADPAMPEGSLWVDISTVGPQFATKSAEWAELHGVRYVHAPVIGSLGPAKAGDLGVLLGGSDADARATSREVVSLWADPERIVEYDSAAKAAVGKLEINYGLAVGMQAIIEAVKIGVAGGLSQAEAIDLIKLPKTPLSIIGGMKANLIASRDYSDTQFSTNLLAKDADLMLTVAEGESLPALTAAFASLEHARRAGHGEDDFASMAG